MPVATSFVLPWLTVDMILFPARNADSAGSIFLNNTGPRAFVIGQLLPSQDAGNGQNDQTFTGLVSINMYEPDCARCAVVAGSIDNQHQGALHDLVPLALRPNGGGMVSDWASTGQQKANPLHPAPSTQPGRAGNTLPPGHGDHRVPAPSHRGQPARCRYDGAGWKHLVHGSRPSQPHRPGCTGRHASGRNTAGQ